MIDLSTRKLSSICPKDRDKLIQWAKNLISDCDGYNEKHKKWINGRKSLLNDLLFDLDADEEMVSEV